MAWHWGHSVRLGALRAWWLRRISRLLLLVFFLGTGCLAMVISPLGSRAALLAGAFFSLSRRRWGQASETTGATIPHPAGGSRGRKVARGASHPNGKATAFHPPPKPSRGASCTSPPQGWRAFAVLAVLFIHWLVFRQMTLPTCGGLARAACRGPLRSKGDLQSCEAEGGRPNKRGKSHPSMLSFLIPDWWDAPFDPRPLWGSR